MGDPAPDPLGSAFRSTGVGMADAARLIVLGRQGSGKGTQCERLSRHLGVPHVSTGDLLRAEVAADTSLGHKVSGYLDSGALVPDELMLDLVAARLGTTSARAEGYLLDGFPRTLAQGQALFEVLGPGAVHLALEIHVPTEVVRPRLAARRVCGSCGAVRSVVPGATEPAPCDACGGELVRRADDTDEAIDRRLRLYDEEAGPLLIWLDSRGVLTTVDGVGTAVEVHQRIVDAVEAAGLTPRPAEGLIDAG
jgi:adenylate kinase